MNIENAISIVALISIAGVLFTIIYIILCPPLIQSKPPVLEDNYSIKVIETFLNASQTNWTITITPR